jgi:type III pantothenate kinase
VSAVTKPKPQPDGRPLVAIDVGNTRTKLGVFVPTDLAPLPVPQRMFSWGPNWNVAELDRWLGEQPARFTWRLASVNQAGSERINAWLATRGVGPPSALSVADIPVPSLVDEPDKVGVDRLVGVLAVNRLRAADRPAVIVSLGTAITVDLVSPEGAFLGGAIMPGIGISARALHEFTDLLPWEPMWELSEPPAALGKTTSGCLQAGLFWGAIGGVRELVYQLSKTGPGPQIFVTGGAGASAARELTRSGEEPAMLVPHLTLSGIAIANPRPNC